MRGNQYNKGNHHSEEFKRIKSKQMHEKYKDGGNPKCKKVIQTNLDGSLIREYFSLREVARTYNVSTATVHNWIYDPKNKEWSYEK
jgi:DNA-binding transcriptional regulator YiaG